MRDLTIGFSFALILTLLLVALFPEYVHIGIISSSTDSTYTQAPDTVWLPYPTIEWRDKPAKHDTVWLPMPDSTIAPVERARLDTTIVSEDSTGRYADELHIEYLGKPQYMWSEIFLKLAPRRFFIPDSSLTVNTQVVIETINWTWAGIIAALFFLLGIAI